MKRLYELLRNPELRSAVVDILDILVRWLKEEVDPVDALEKIVGVAIELMADSPQDALELVRQTAIDRIAEPTK